MPEAVDPGIASGFHAADQQSYLQQVLANTRAEQNNAAQIKAKQDQRTFDPSVFEDPSLPPEEHAARKRDALSFAQGAQPGPDGRPLAIYKSADELKNMLDFVKTQSGQRASVQGDKNLADATEQNLQPRHMGPDGKPDPLIAKHLQVLRGSNPLDPNRAESRKVIGDLGLYKASVPLGAQPVDTTGAPISGPNLPGAGSGGGPAVVMPDSPEGRQRQNAGMQADVKMVVNPMTGMTTPTVDWKDVRGGKDITTWHAYQDLRNSNAIPASVDYYDAMRNPATASLITRNMMHMQAESQGDRVHVTNITNQQDKLNGPADQKTLANLWIPEHGDFAANIPGMHGKSAKELADNYGAVDATTRGGLANVMKSQQAVDAGKRHIDEIIKSWDAAHAAGLIPDKNDAQIPGAVQAKLAAWKNSIIAGNEPILAGLTALGAGDLNILSAMAPPTGNRFGYSLMKYVNEKNPAVLGSQGYSYEGGRQSLLEWRNLAGIKGQTQGVGALNAKPGQMENVPAPSAPPASAGVSGQSPYAKWKASQGVQP